MLNVTTIELDPASREEVLPGYTPQFPRPGIGQNGAGRKGHLPLDIGRAGDYTAITLVQTNCREGVIDAV